MIKIGQYRDKQQHAKLHSDKSFIALAFLTKIEDSAKNQDVKPNTRAKIL